MNKQKIIEILKAKGEKVNKWSTLAIWESDFESVANEILEALVNKNECISDVSVALHECEYCGAMTTQSDDECYKKPSK